MVLEDWIKLNDIHIKFIEYEVSLQELRELYFRAKKIFIDRQSYLNKTDVNLLLDILFKGYEIVGEFWKKWQKKEISPTDEELGLLEEAFEEWSQIFNQLSGDYPHLFSLENNRIRQQTIQKNKQIVAEEKQRRKNPDPNNPPYEPNQKKIDNSNHLFTKENVFFFFFFF